MTEVSSSLCPLPEDETSPKSESSEARRVGPEQSQLRAFLASKVKSRQIGCLVIIHERNRIVKLSSVVNVVLTLSAISAMCSKGSWYYEDHES